MSDEQQQERTTTTQRATALRDFLKEKLDMFERALAGRMDSERYIQVVLNAFLADDRLQRASFFSTYAAALECANTGLKPDGEEAAIIPYWNKSEQCYEANFQPGYIGLIRLMLRAGAKKVEARVVREGDHFKYGYGLNPYLEHEPLRAGTVDREVTAAYGVIWLPDGTVQFEVVEGDELRKIQEFAKRASGGNLTPARRDWEDQMHRKAPLRRLRKFVELDAECSAAFRKDAALDGGQVVALGDLDPRFEVRSISERATDHARRQIGELSGAIDRAENGEGGEDPRQITSGEDDDGGDPTADPGPVRDEEPPSGSEPKARAPDPRDMDKLDLDSRVPSGKYKGKAWRQVLREDLQYCADVCARGWVLEGKAMDGLKAHVAYRQSGQWQEEERRMRGEASEPPAADDDAGEPDPELASLYERGKDAATELAKYDRLSIDESEELDLLHADGAVADLRTLVETLEARLPDPEPELFDDKGDDDE